MKTRSTYQQTNTRLLTLAIAALLSLSLFGMETETPKASTSKASAPTVEIEQDIQLEDWMLNLNQWELSNNEEVIVEEELIIEEWMLSATIFSAQHSDLDIEDSEAELEIESWMVDLNKW